MFVDKVKIFIKAGNGGNGMVAFRREKYVPDGGPAGGDGGRGSDIIFEVDEGLRTLMDFRYQKHFKAPSGENGRAKRQHGEGAKPMIVRVPPGTTVVDDDTGEVIADLVRQEQQAIIAKAGRGGRGNCRFATPKNPAPYVAENGEPGQERNITLELKVLADVGLVGFPSVGKSTLLSVVSAAKPKIADYHFTTLTPNLGMVDAGESSFVMADLPGLIEGAHEGVGLGHQFLKHIERTRIIVHVLDMSGSEGRDPYQDFIQINNELKLYNYRLEERSQIVVANKMDLPQAEENLEAFRQRVGEVKIFPISAVTQKGTQELIYAIADLLDTIPQTTFEQEIVETPEEHVTYRFQEEDQGFRVYKDIDGIFVLEGDRIEKLFKMTKFDFDESARKFARTLRHMGVDKALRDIGAEDGDVVRVLEFEFEFTD